MLEIDEGNQFARGHPGIHVVPAVLAAAEELGSRGSDVLLAIALGYEIGSRIGIASKLRVTMHPHGTWGRVGAAVAVAKLRHATREQMAEVINVSSTLGLATSRRTMLEGGTVRNSFAGFLNEIGLRAWEMVDAGFVGEAVKIALVDGRILSAEAYTNRGDTEDPYSAEEVRDKFHEVAGSVWSKEHCSSILEAVEDLERSPDLAALSRLLAA